jgi:hypothetical protein
VVQPRKFIGARGRGAEGRRKGKRRKEVNVEEIRKVLGEYIGYT